MMQREGAYIAEVMKLMECVGSEEGQLIKVVVTHLHHTNSTLLQTVKKFKESFQSETKQIKQNS